MGADLVLAVLEVPERYNDYVLSDGYAGFPIRFDAFVDDLSDLIASVDDFTLTQIVHNTIGLYDDDNPREVIGRAVNELRNYRERRDVDLINVGGTWAFVSGGMSWGDPPTDFYTALKALSRVTEHGLE